VEKVETPPPPRGPSDDDGRRAVGCDTCVVILILIMKVVVVVRRRGVPLVWFVLQAWQTRLLMERHLSPHRRRPLFDTVFFTQNPPPKPTPYY
jgi:hypothetical protein